MIEAEALEMGGGLCRCCFFAGMSHRESIEWLRFLSSLGSAGISHPESIEWLRFLSSLGSADTAWPTLPWGLRSSLLEEGKKELLTLGTSSFVEILSEMAPSTAASPIPEEEGSLPLKLSFTASFLPVVESCRAMPGEYTFFSLCLFNLITLVVLLSTELGADDVETFFDDISPLCGPGP